MTVRQFDLDGQLAFARLSGDFNPLHVDPLAARRLLFGRPVVHGIHALLWAIDQWVAAQTRGVGISSLKVVFEKPIGLDESASLSIEAGPQGEVRLEIRGDGLRSTRISLHVSGTQCAPTVEIIPGQPPKRPCREWPAEQLPSAAGDIDLYFDETSARRLFPNLVDRLPLSQLAVLLATTRLVGTECPGLHSIFSELELRFMPEKDAAGPLHYHVQRFDQRFAALTLGLSGAGVIGTIKAFMRPLPQAQPEAARLTGMVSADEFAGQRALVIGGSRGLGEVSAKLLAAGGAAVTLTYHRGANDAERVVGEIVAAGGRASAVPFDVLSPDRVRPDQEPSDPAPIGLYYFATPPIFVGAKGAFQPALFRRFCDYYVTGLVHALATFRRPATAALGVFYPSSVAIDEQPVGMSEYVAAKTAGESLCQALSKHDKRLDIYCPRLPRTATDQTVSLFPIHNEDSATVMLRHLRTFRDRRIAAGHRAPT